MNKHCNVCDVEKPLEDFHRLEKAPDGRQPKCKTCVRRYMAQRYVDGRERFRADDRFRMYGISNMEFQELLAKQGNVCGLCGQPETMTYRGKGGKPRDLAIDHCHTTGKVRGLLCNNCNRGLGLLQDDPDLLVKAAEYLRSGGYV